MRSLQISVSHRKSVSIVAACCTMLSFASSNARAQSWWGSSTPTIRPAVVMNVPKASQRTASHNYQAETTRLLDTIPVVRHDGKYHTDKLAGSSAGDLYALYVGMKLDGKEKIPVKLKVDWNKQLGALCDLKASLSGTTAVRDTCNSLVAEYQHLDPQTMSLGEYQAVADEQSRLVQNSINWSVIGKFYFLDHKTHVVNSRKLALLKRVSATVDGHTLIAYAGAELCPTSGSYCMAFLDFMLRNGGRRYVESLPALHDRLTSFGPFQFTAKAVYDIGNGREIGGVSRANRALPQSLRVPGSVSLFRGNDHLRAAKLYAISNLAMLIRRLNNQQLVTLESIAGSRHLDWTQVIATAHNNPEVAYRSAAQWLTKKARSEYSEQCPPACKKYANKTSGNYRALAAL